MVLELVEEHNVTRSWFFDIRNKAQIIIKQFQIVKIYVFCIKQQQLYNPKHMIGFTQELAQAFVDVTQYLLGIIFFAVTFLPEIHPR